MIFQTGDDFLLQKFIRTNASLRISYASNIECVLLAWSNATFKLRNELLYLVIH